MVDVLPPPPPGDRIEFRGIEVEMQRSYLDYAMSVIVGRALPDVRDGLKPVHRRVLYAMYDGGYRPDRGYFKCARVVGDVMGNYHPHGDASIYDALVRLAQPWSLRYPMIDGNGNFGSPGNDPPAAQRYCVTGDALVRSAEGRTWRIGEIVPGVRANSDNTLDDVKVLGRQGEPVAASLLFHSGDHPTLRLRTREGYQLTGSQNHPVLCLQSLAGVPRLEWKTLEQVSPGDRVVLYRGVPESFPVLSDADRLEAVLLGAFVSEGHCSATRAGFNNTDRDFFDDVVQAYDLHVGGPRYTSHRFIASGSLLHELDVQRTDALRESVLFELMDDRSADKSVPARVWSQGPAYKKAFLQALYEGDGSCSKGARDSLQVTYSTRSVQLAHDVQQLLLEFGVVSRLIRHATGEWKVWVGNRRDVRLFQSQVGFFGRKHVRLLALTAGVPASSTAMSSDHVPFVGSYLRGEGARRGSREWLGKHNVDRLERWERDGDLIRSHITETARSVVEPLVTGQHYYAEVVTVEDAGVQPVYSLRVDSDEHAFLTNGIVSHNTECRLQPLAMELLRDIDQETVDFSANYDGRSLEPDVLPSRIPNLLVNGSAGIAVGMATNIPPHNLREVVAGVHWALDHPEATDEELQDALLARIQGPDFPTGALIVGKQGIYEAYRTGRGSITMRAVVEVDEDAKGRTILVATELPYQVNPDNLALSIADLVREGRVSGIADVRDEGSQRVGQRLVVVLKRDAVAKVVLNNLYKHTQLQYTFGANMLSIVDGVPRTLRLDEMVRFYVAHQVDVIVRRTRYRLRKAEERAHILRGYGKALDRLDDVIALIRASDSADAAREGLIALLDIDDIQALAILDMQLRRLAALERQRILDELAEREAEIADLTAILADPVRQRRIIAEELAEAAERFGDERRTRIIPFEGDMSAEDLIAQEDVVVTVTRGGYAKRTRTELYRSQRRGGKGVRGAQLKQDDIVEHFFVTTTHHWILFFTNMGRVYRAKAHELPETGRDARGAHIANVLAFQPDEHIAQVMDIRDYGVAPYLVLATRKGLVKKTALGEYDNGRSSGLIAINLREDDELIAAALINPDDDLLLVSRQAQSIRFRADDDALRPMGRATSGVMGIRLRGDDELLAMVVADDEEAALMVVTDGGFGKRTALTEYKQQGRGGSGVLTAAIAEKRGQLVGALVVRDTDEVFAVTSSGVVIRVPVAGLRLLSRATGGVKLISLEGGATVVSVARNGEAEAEVEQALDTGAEPVPAEIVAAEIISTQVGSDDDLADEPVVFLDDEGELVEQSVAEHLDNDAPDEVDGGSGTESPQGMQDDVDAPTGSRSSAPDGTYADDDDDTASTDPTDGDNA